MDKVTLAGVSLAIARSRQLDKKANEKLDNLINALSSTHKTWTTPLGAALGYGASRALIPEEDRSLVNTGLSVGAGGWGGYALGGLLDSEGKLRKDQWEEKQYEAGVERPTPQMMIEAEKQGIISKDAPKGIDPKSIEGDSVKARVNRMIVNLNKERKMLRDRQAIALRRGDKARAQELQKGIDELEGKMTSRKNYVGAVMDALGDRAADIFRRSDDYLGSDE